MRIRYGMGALVVCPVCGSHGRLYYYNGEWRVKHGSRSMHYVNSGESIEFVYNRIRGFSYYGGDYLLVPYLVKMLAPHKVYVEVFGGSAKLLLSKSPSNIEVYNDIDGDLVSVFKTIRDNPDGVIAELMTIPYSRRMYYEILAELERRDLPRERRAAYYIFLLQSSFSSRYRSGFATSKHQNRAKKYYSIIEAIRPLHERIRNVIIEDLDFRELIRKYDSRATLFYLDPPHLYVATEKTRESYKYNMTDKDYIDMIELLDSIEGKFLLRQSWPPGFLLEWAKKYHVRSVRVKITSRMDANNSRREQVVYFIANYRI